MPGYNDKLDPDLQISAEEKIAVYLYDESMADEETAAEAGRYILRMILEQFRPDLFE